LEHDAEDGFATASVHEKLPGKPDLDPQKSEADLGLLINHHFVTKNNEVEGFIGGYFVQGDGVQQVGPQWQGVDQTL
jgi:hypothetical protein